MTSRDRGSKARSRVIRVWFFVIAAASITGCTPDQAPPPPLLGAEQEYQIGPGDSLNVFVWRNPELSLTVPVRPDGRFSMPLVEDIQAAGRTTTELARDLEKRLATYVKDPIITVMPVSFIGPFDQQVRVVGEAVTPRALPYRANMTVLDAMIQVGGLTKYAAGDRATLVRNVHHTQEYYTLRLESLLNDGEVEYNFPLAPGDIITIPQSYF